MENPQTAITRLLRVPTLEAMSRSARPDGSEVVVCDSSQCKRPSKQIAVVHTDTYGFDMVLDGDTYIAEDFWGNDYHAECPKDKGP